MKGSIKKLFFILCALPLLGATAPSGPGPLAPPRKARVQSSVTATVGTDMIHVHRQTADGHTVQIRFGIIGQGLTATYNKTGDMISENNQTKARLYVFSDGKNERLIGIAPTSGKATEASVYVISPNAPMKVFSCTNVREIPGPLNGCTNSPLPQSPEEEQKQAANEAGIRNCAARIREEARLFIKNSFSSIKEPSNEKAQAAFYRPLFDSVQKLMGYTPHQ